MVIDTMHIKSLFRQASNFSGHLLKNLVFRAEKYLTTRFLSNEKLKKILLN